MSSEHPRGFEAPAGGERVTIVSADTHGGADLRGYRWYLESDLHEEFDAWADDHSTEWPDLLDEDANRNWNTDRRRGELEADGIVAEVVFPNTSPPFYPEPHLAGTLPANEGEYRRRWAGLRAHNRWLVDFCAEAAGFRRGLIQVFPNVVEDAVGEIEWALGQPGLCGVLFPSVPPNTLEPVYRRLYDPIWRLCAEAGFPVVTHARGGAPTLPADPATLPVLIYEYGFWSHRTLWHLVLGGVFERHPGLRYVITEQGGPSWLSRLKVALDTKFETLVDPNKQTVRFDNQEMVSRSMLPSEHIARNCWLGASFCQPHEMPHRYDVGVHRIMWGSDYPHREGTTPHSREALRATFAEVPAGETRAMLGENAASLYGFNLSALNDRAAQVGPTFSELAVPLEAAPADSTSYAFHPEYIATY
ncbi:amidohydrolase family protein [Candidatus Poriferisocius sp.]|uniref:amidohydrolase family protein n=1 Tax=Candidatus Poriferisocius sp. TaxID=3101276 RepID=UPI003B01E377